MDALLREADAFFMGETPVHAAAEALTRRLRDARIDYAIAGILTRLADLSSPEDRVARFA